MKSAIRVAITGIGIVSPLGNDTQTTWDSLLASRSGVAPIANFDAAKFPTRIAAEVKNFQPDPQIPTKIRKYTVSLTDFALTAAQQAFDDAKIKPNAMTAKRWGVV